MLKYICIVMIVSASAMGGIYFSSALKNRVISLKQINYMLEEIYIMLRYRSATVYEIVETLCNDERFAGLDFLKELKFSAENSFQESWCRAVEKNIPSGLKKSDRELLLNIGKKLGTSDLEGQLGAVKLRQAETAAAVSSAEEEYSRKAKLYRTLGVLTGVFIAIMLV